VVDGCADQVPVAIWFPIASVPEGRDVLLAHEGFPTVRIGRLHQRPDLVRFPGSKRSENATHWAEPPSPPWATKDWYCPACGNDRQRSGNIPPPGVCPACRTESHGVLIQLGTRPARGAAE
jgi:hypothetical protein